jgi:hypothetical protein
MQIILKLILAVIIYKVMSVIDKYKYKNNNKYKNNIRELLWQLL